MPINSKKSSKKRKDIFIVYMKEQPDPEFLIGKLNEEIIKIESNYADDYHDGLIDGMITAIRLIKELSM